MRPLIVVSALCLAQTALAAEGEFSLGTGLNYTTGTYGGSTSTKILTIPFNARYDNGPWTFKATLPYLHITGVRAVYPGVGRVDNGTLDNLLGVPRNRSQTETHTASGMGDAAVAATYTIYSGGARAAARAHRLLDAPRRSQLAHAGLRTARLRARQPRLGRRPERRLRLLEPAALPIFA